MDEFDSVAAAGSIVFSAVYIASLVAVGVANDDHLLTSLAVLTAALTFLGYATQYSFHRSALIGGIFSIASWIAGIAAGAVMLLHHFP